MRNNYYLLSINWGIALSYIIVALLLIAVIVIIFVRKRKRNVANTQNEVPVKDSPKSRYRFSIFIIKFFILVGIVVFALWNYRLFEINKGWSTTKLNNNGSISQTIEIITDIEKIEYYEFPHSCKSEYYNVHISTSTKSYLFSATSNDIKMLNALGNLSLKIKPKSIFVIPFYVEIIVGLFVIFVPIGRKR